jgi:hypothetical protein
MLLMRMRTKRVATVSFGPCELGMDAYALSGQAAFFTREALLPIRTTGSFL